MVQKSISCSSKEVESLQKAVEKQGLECQKCEGKVSDWSKKVSDAENDIEKNNQALKQNEKYLQEAKQVPIIPMTAQSSEESKEGCRAAGMNSHLTKPIEPDSLVQTILETAEHAFGK